MSKKGISNTEKTGAWAAIKKELPMISRSGERTKKWVNRNARGVFYGLWALVIISLGYNLYRMAMPAEPLPERGKATMADSTAAPAVPGDGPGFSPGSAIDKIIELRFVKKELDRIERSGGNYTREDSIFLDSLIREIRKTK